jgi:hypothetical protein
MGLQIPVRLVVGLPHSAEVGLAVRRAVRDTWPVVRVIDTVTTALTVAAACLSQ